MPDASELDRLFLLWSDSLWRAFGISAAQAERARDLYKFGSRASTARRRIWWSCTSSSRRTRCTESRT